MSNKATVMSALAQMGERPGAAARSLRGFERSAQVLSSNHPRLIDEYGNKWIAISDSMVVAHGTSLDKVLRKVDRQKLPRSDVIVRFIERSPGTLVL
jgi:hypothetical protein